ncbi:hypothetical protein GCM10023196_011840 [Actinoallomurus vinaceus]|uniref:Uncharacterized protein n=1 Tax=Actinoallomurus vinaceus TaxID=1080074 RepID=A0ABP8U6P1_9ACTN
MALGANAPSHFEPVELGKAEIQDDEVHPAPERPLESLRTVGTDFDVVSLPPQRSGERLGYGRVVLGEQN